MTSFGDTSRFDISRDPGSGEHRRNLIHIRQQEWSSDKPLVSVIIPCFNYGKYLEEAVDSVLAQTFSDLEIIVVESGSTDGVTKEIVSKMRRAKTRVFLRRHRHPPGDNRNYGIKKARGKYVCCLDADDTLEPTFLEKALFLLECAGFDLVSTSYRGFGERNDEVLLPPHPSFSQIVSGASSPSLAVMAKSFWTRSGGYHDSGRREEHVPEDWDFYVRAVGLSARIYNLQEPLLNVRWHADSLHRAPVNSSYAQQLQALRRRHRNRLGYKNFQSFDQRNEEIIRVASAMRNLLKRQSGRQSQQGSLIVPPFCSDESEALLHLEKIAETGIDGNKVILCFGRFAELPARLSQEYARLTAHRFSLANTAGDPLLKSTLLDYLLASRQISKFIVGSTAFGHDNTAQLIALYDLLEQVVN